MKQVFLSVLAFVAFGATMQAQNGTPAIDKGAMDLTVNPCQNFYRYACGTWIKQNAVPAAFARWGRFNELQERNRDTLHAILDDAVAHEDRSPMDQKIGAFYESCMDDAKIESLGAKPVEPEIRRVRELKDKHELPAEVARFHLQGLNVFFSFGSSPDEDNARIQIADADQGGLGLPDKDFYFRKDAKSQQTRDEYVKHISRIFQLLGDDQKKADAEANRTMAIETSLASSALGRVERRDPQKTHHKMSIADFEALFPQFDFRHYLQESGAMQFTNLNVGVPAFYSNLNKLLDRTSLDDLKTYLIWHYVSSYSRDLSEPFVQENFAFYMKYLTGAQELLPRWKRCVQYTDNALGELLGQEYVAKAFAGASKQQTRALVAQIEHEMEVDIQSLTWMSDSTKQQAIVKLHGVTNKIGYPDRWKDYSSVEIKNGDFVGDDRRSREFEDKRDLNKIGKPVDRSEWGMTPPTVNAYYNPLENNINFPAGILQQPFYSASRDNAVNFGAIGAVIGHELTHGFDDQGRQFDADGNLHDWWTKQDGEEFKKRAECIANEYEKFSPVPDVHLNGHLTLGENGADNGGLRLAFMALEDALQDGSVSSEKIDGFTPKQRFFLGYAQLWCETARPQESLRLAQTNPHSPGEFRVNGVVQNMSQFGVAFGCTEGQPMVAANGCRVW